ncbi:hypothetical protein QBC46DRAFT_356047 [Diplogelasinospora grovesii]|uniref:Uncharacterized protein n=1 Tax=Diplogelasinospora grovesii TaxID=303347 RepID=A0AAN6N2U7_9PEZI|nr:hypothetical protein QBC46DRAFT_356047 [Diplogelasinospora grovesii]
MAASAAPPLSIDIRKRKSQSELPSSPILSINAIIREHCRSRLYVPPILWSSSHPRLLGCSFVAKKIRLKAKSRQEGRKEGNVKDTAEERKQQNSETLRAATQLYECLSLEVKKLAVRELLAACDIHPLNSDRLPLRFNRSVVSTLQTDGVYSSNSATPFLAYINLDTIVSLRRKYIHTPPCDRINPPVAALRQKKLRFLKPQVEAEDPYLVALAIALAQEQRQRQEQQQRQDVTTAEQTPKAQVPTSCYKVHLLAIPGIDAETLYVYSAYIPSGFLDSFDMPSRSSLISCNISILYYHIPLARPVTLLKTLRYVLRAGARPEMQDQTQGSA